MAKAPEDLFLRAVMCCAQICLNRHDGAKWPREISSKLPTTVDDKEVLCFSVERIFMHSNWAAVFNFISPSSSNFLLTILS